MENMTHDEMRAIRRDFINKFLHDWPYWGGYFNSYQTTRKWIRTMERWTFGKELKAYE